VEMSGMKKWCFVIIVAVVIVSMLNVTGCEEAKETIAESNATVAESILKGEVYENSKFSITVPAGWIKSYETESSVWLNTEDEVFGIVVEISRNNVTEADIKAEVEELIKSKNGTPLKEATMLGIKFFTTSVIDGTLDQTAYIGVRNGERVSIILAGKDHKNNNEMKAILESIKFK